MGRKKGCVIGACVAFLFFTWTVASHGAGKSNLIRNGDFEIEKELKFWTGWPAPANISLDNEIVHGGKGSLRLSNEKGVSSKAYQDVTLDYDKPSEVTFSFWCKRKGADRYAQAGLDFAVIYQDGSTPKLFWYAINPNKDETGVKEWVKYEGSFKIEKPAKTISVWPLIYCGDEIYPAGKKNELAAPETAWFDDIFVNVTEIEQGEY